MEYSIDPFTYFFGNLKKMCSLDSDMFSVFLNKKEIKLPLFAASLISTKIMKLLIEDSTVRTLEIDINFKNVNTEEKIKRMLQSGKQTSIINFENEEEMRDMANFGVLFGNESFIEPLTLLFDKQEKEKINEENVISRIESKDILSRGKNNAASIEEEIEYISQNFSKLYDKKSFIEWSKNNQNEDRVERILNNKKFKLDKEDDLFNYIAEISKETNRFVRLLSHVHLNLCTVDTCKKLIDLMKDEDIFKSRNNRNAIIGCLKNRLLYYSNFNCDVITFLTQELRRNLAIKDSKGRDSLNIAACNGNLEAIKYICGIDGVSNKKYRADVETKDKDGYTPLFYASSNGHLEVVKYLYETRNANVEVKDKYGNTPISSASENGHLDVVKYLYETCHAKVPYNAINKASENGHLEVVKYLYEKCHADVKIKDDNGRTPITNASLKGHFSIVKYLSETCHSNIDTKDYIGRTPINWASLNGHFDIVKYLYEKCYANVEAEDNDGNAPINNASINEHFEIVKYLSEKCHSRGGVKFL